MIIGDQQRPHDLPNNPMVPQYIGLAYLTVDVLFLIR